MANCAILVLTDSDWNIVSSAEEYRTVSAILEQRRLSLTHQSHRIRSILSGVPQTIHYIVVASAVGNAEGKLTLLHKRRYHKLHIRIIIDKSPDAYLHKLMLGIPSHQKAAAAAEEDQPLCTAYLVCHLCQQRQVNTRKGPV